MLEYCCTILRAVPLRQEKPADPHHLKARLVAVGSVCGGVPGVVRADRLGASHSRSRTARRERHATETPGQPRQRAGGHAPQPAGRAKPSRTPRRPLNRTHQRKHYK